MSCDLLPAETPGQHYQSDVRDVLNAFECRTKLARVTQWLEANQPDVFSRGLWDAINASSGDAVVKLNVAA